MTKRGGGMSSGIGTIAFRSTSATLLAASLVATPPARASSSASGEVPATTTPVRTAISVEVDLGAEREPQAQALQQELVVAIEARLGAHAELAGNLPERVLLSVVLIDQEGEQSFRGRVRLVHPEPRAGTVADVECIGCGANAFVARVAAVLDTQLPAFARTIEQARSSSEPTAAPVETAAATTSATTPLPRRPQTWKPSGLAIAGFSLLGLGIGGLAVSAGFFEHNRRDPAPRERATTIREATSLGMALSVAYVVTGLTCIGVDVRLFRREQRGRVTFAPSVSRSGAALSIAGRF